MDSSGDSIKSSSGRFLQTLRPIRNLESNWEVDLAKNLEEYLLQICSGNVSSQDAEIFSVNFAEAALLLQGSVQVYGRKVEYLHSLVLNALDFISNKSREGQASGATDRNKDANPQTSNDQGADLFWCMEEIAVDAKNMLDSSISRDAATTRYFVRPPANLAVLEGECLEPSGDSGELESYLLATINLYRDFLLLDPSDAVVVDDIIDCKVASKGRKSSQMPSRKPGRNTPKLLVKKLQDISENQSQSRNHGFESNENDLRNSQERGFEFDDDRSDSEGVDSDEDDDPWKPLNPHEPGCLKVKPYKKVKAKKRRDPCSAKHQQLMAELPLAKRNGLICEELNEIWEETYGAAKPESISLYDKLWQSLVAGQQKRHEPAKDVDVDVDDDDDDDENDGGDDREAGPSEFGAESDTFREEDPPLRQEIHEEPEANVSLEDLCRAHLDSLLASLAENSMQSELSSRVSTWKQRIEQNLEEQEMHPPFDIDEYGERVLNNLSVQGVAETPLPVSDVVKAETKYDVARSFSALLQLVNNGDVDLVRNESSTDGDPFYVRLLEKKRNVKRDRSHLEEKSKSPRQRKMKAMSNRSRSSSSSSEAVAVSSPLILKHQEGSAS